MYFFIMYHKFIGFLCFLFYILLSITYCIFIYQLQSGIHMYLVSFWKCKITHSVFRCICTVCEMTKTCHTLPLELCMVYEMKETCHTLPLELCMVYEMKKTCHTLPLELYITNMHKKRLISTDKCFIYQMHGLEITCLGNEKLNLVFVWWYAIMCVYEKYLRGNKY